MIIAEGHVKMTLRFSICSKYAVTPRSNKNWQFSSPRTLRVSGSARGGLKMKRKKNKKKTRGITAHMQRRLGALLHFWRKPGRNQARNVVKG